MSPDTPPPPPPPPFANPPAFNPAAPRSGGPPKTSGAAVASMILGVTSLACLCATALPGLICGFVGLSNIGKSNGQLKGRGLAIGGIILSLLMPFAGTAAWVAVGGRHVADNPMFQELFGAGKSMLKGATQGAEIAAALRVHADANGGRLPASLEELVAAGGLDAGKLGSPVDGSSGFWTLTEPGAVLADLPGKTVIARGGPIAVQGESLEVAIFADGTVEPRDAGSAAEPPAEDATFPGQESAGTSSSEGPSSDDPAAAEPVEVGPAVPSPVETPDAPGR